MKSLHDIEVDVIDMAARIAAPAGILPTFGRTQDGARPHIEVASGAYHYVVVERGCELDRRRTPDYNELLYWIFADVTHAMAFRYELHHRIEDQDCRRIAFPKQVELMAMLGPASGDRMRQEIERVLAKAPYDDEAMRAANRRRE